MSSSPPNPCRKPLECITGGKDNKLIVWTASAILVPIALTIFSTILSLVISSSQRIAMLEAEFHDLKSNLVRIERNVERLLERTKQ